MMWLLGAALAAGPADGQSACDWLVGVRAKGADDNALYLLARKHRDAFTGADMACLKDNRFHSRIREMLAEGRVLDGAPSRAQTRAAASGRATPGRYDVEFLGVLVAAGRDGKTWDGDAAIDTVVQAGFDLWRRELTPTAPLPEAQKLIDTARRASSSTAPDVTGWLAYKSGAAPTLAKERRPLVSEPVYDAFWVPFPERPGGQGLRLTGDDRLRMALYDDDTGSTESIAVLELGPEIAGHGRKPVYIDTSAQSGGTVLGVVVAVRPSTAPHPALR